MTVEKIVFVALLAAMLGGCASNSTIAYAEREEYQRTIVVLNGGDPDSDEETRITNPFLDTVSENTAYALNLANLYYEQARQTSVGQEAVAFGVIGAATAGASAVVFDGHIDILKSVGIAAGALTATSNYLAPAEATSALLNAAEQLICVAEVSRRVVNADSSLERSVAMLEMVQSAIRTIRLNLRRELARTPPDYSSLFAQISSPPGTNAQSLNADQRKLLAEINEDILACTVVRA